MPCRSTPNAQGHHLTGYAALPTYSRGSAVQQFLFVNGRPVRDKLLIGALRGAYADFLSRDRHPAACLFVDCDPHLVDVNVHPAKSEVRFRHPGTVRGLIVSGLRHALAEAGHRAATTVAGATLGAFRPEPTRPRIYQMDRPSTAASRASYQAQAPGFSELVQDFSGRVEPVMPPDSDESQRLEERPLGAARAQIHENYIIAQTDTGLIIVDQHAAHERLVYEKLKAQMAANGVAAQALLIPEIVELSDADAAALLEIADDLSRLGLTLEHFWRRGVCVRVNTRAILGGIREQPKVWMRGHHWTNSADTGPDQTAVKDRIDAILSSVAMPWLRTAPPPMRADEMERNAARHGSHPHFPGNATRPAHLSKWKSHALSHHREKHVRPSA